MRGSAKISSPWESRVMAFESSFQPKSAKRSSCCISDLQAAVGTNLLRLEVARSLPEQGRGKVITCIPRSGGPPSLRRNLRAPWSPTCAGRGPAGHCTKRPWDRGRRPRRGESSTPAGRAGARLGLLIAPLGSVPDRIPGTGGRASGGAGGPRPQRLGQRL